MSEMDLTLKRSDEWRIRWKLFIFARFPTPREGQEDAVGGRLARGRWPVAAPSLAASRSTIFARPANPAALFYIQLALGPTRRRFERHAGLPHTVRFPGARCSD